MKFYFQLAMWCHDCGPDGWFGAWNELSDYTRAFVTEIGQTWWNKKNYFPGHDAMHFAWCEV